MKSIIELDLDKKILNITNIIYKEYPELVKYITEIPESNSKGQEFNVENLQRYYGSLQDIINKYSLTHTPKNAKENMDINEPQWYPHYPPEEDIYQNNKLETEINLDDLSQTKKANKISDTMNEKSFEDDFSGSDLDVPGSELDDYQESIGNEDEENNYYSLGGDNHNDLEEDKG